MAVDKSLYQAPQGLESLAQDEPAIEIEVVDPEAVHIRVGDNQIDIEPGENEDTFNDNLAEEMDERDLQSLASELLGDYDEDVSSRKDWLDTYVKGLKLLGLKYEERTEPWPGACGVYHPLLMEAAIKFQAENIMDTFPAMGPVKTQIIGKETPQKKEAMVRVQDDMNYTLTEKMKEYRPEHERLLVSLALSGNAFKKVYYDPTLDMPAAPFISSEDIIVPYGATNIESAERVTHRMRKTKNELRKLQVAGFYKDVDLGDPVRVLDEVEKQKALEQGFNATADDRFQVLEMHVDIDMPGHEDPDGIALPYVVTIEKGTNTVLAIRRNWLEDDKERKRRQHFVHYGYIPGFGFYYFGLIHLIGGHAKAATSLLRQLVDAGTLSNLPGGMKTRGLRIKGDDTPIAPGEFRDVDIPSGALRDNILPLPYKEPSQTLSQLMDKIVDDGRRYAATADLNVSDMSAQAPVGTTLAVLERQLKVLSAVQARVHYTMKQEFRLLRDIIRDNTPEEYDYQPEVGKATAKRSDYDDVDVIPVSDPNASTMAQKVVQYQAVFQLAQSAPQLYNLPYLHRQMIEVLGVKHAEKIVPLPEDQSPTDPVTESMNVLMGKPVKAFLHQDHEAHIGVHMAAMQDPKLAAIMGQNPQAQTIQASAMAHIMEHVALHYRKEIEKQLGATLPVMKETDQGAYESKMSPEMEVQLSPLVSQAAAKLLQKHTGEVQQQQAQQQQQDPLIQMQQQELQIKQQDVQGKAQQAQQELQFKQQQAQQDAQLKQAEMQFKQQQAQQDTQLKQAEMQLKQQQMQQELQIRMAEIQAKKSKDVMDAAAKADQLDAKQQLDGTKLGVDIAKHHAERAGNSPEAQQRAEMMRMQQEQQSHAADQRRQAERHNLELGKAQATHMFESDKARAEHVEQTRMNREKHDLQLELARKAQQQTNKFDKKEPAKK